MSCVRAFNHSSFKTEGYIVVCTIILYFDDFDFSIDTIDTENQYDWLLIFSTFILSIYFIQPKAV